MDGPRTPLLRPSRYFAAHDGSPPVRHALAAVVAVTLATAAATAVVLGEFAAALDATVTIDNPAYPGDQFCADSPFTDTPSGCGEPAQVERELGRLVADRFSWLPLAAVAFGPVFWLLQSVVLHAASLLAGGEGGFRETLVVVGWGMVPSLARVVGVGALLVGRLRSVAVPSNPESAVDALAAAVNGVGVATAVAAVGVAVWGGAIRVFGVARVHRLSVRTALAVVGLLTVVGLAAELP